MNGELIKCLSLQSKMQTEQDDQKAKGDGQKDDADKKSETEEMEVTD